MTYILSFIVAFGVAAIVGQILIPLLRRLKAGQSIRADGPTWHMTKQGTPTMGGIMFIAAVIAVVLGLGWRDVLEGNWQALFVLAFALIYGAIGFVDDYAKIRKKENTGLTAGWKFLLQLAAAIAFLEGDKITKDHTREQVEAEYREGAGSAYRAAEGGFVTVDRSMATNLPGVFAAGDCTGGPLQISKAIGEGLVAGQKAAAFSGTVTAPAH